MYLFIIIIMRGLGCDSVQCVSLGARGRHLLSVALPLLRLVCPPPFSSVKMRTAHSSQSRLHHLTPQHKSPPTSQSPQRPSLWTLIRQTPLWTLLLMRKSQPLKAKTLERPSPARQDQTSSQHLSLLWFSWAITLPWRSSSRSPWLGFRVHQYKQWNLDWFLYIQGRIIFASPIFRKKQSSNPPGACNGTELLNPEIAVSWDAFIRWFRGHLQYRHNPSGAPWD